MWARRAPKRNMAEPDEGRRREWRGVAKSKARQPTTALARERFIFAR